MDASHHILFKYSLPSFLAEALHQAVHSKTATHKTSSLSRLPQYAMSNSYTNADSGPSNNENEDSHDKVTPLNYHPSLNLPPEIDSIAALQAFTRSQTAPTSVTGPAAVEPTFTIDNDAEDAPVTYQNADLFAALHPVEMLENTQHVVRQATASDPPAGPSSATFNPTAPPFEMDFDTSDVDFKAAAAEIRQREIDNYRRWLFRTNPHLYPPGVTADELIELTRSIPPPYGIGVFAVETTDTYGGSSHRSLTPALGVGIAATGALAKFPVDVEAIWGPLPPPPPPVTTNTSAPQPERGQQPERESTQVPVEHEPTVSSSTARTRTWIEAIGEGREEPNQRPDGPAGNPFANPDASAALRSSPPSMVAEPTDGPSTMRDNEFEDLVNYEEAAE